MFCCHYPGSISGGYFGSFVVPSPAHCPVCVFDSIIYKNALVLGFFKIKARNKGGGEIAWSYLPLIFRVFLICLYFSVVQYQYSYMTKRHLSGLKIQQDISILTKNLFQFFCPFLIRISISGTNRRLDLPAQDLQPATSYLDIIPYGPILSQKS